MSDKNIQIAQHEADTLFLYAFRYALGRSTYASAEMAELIIKYKDKISWDLMFKICEEAIVALKKSNAVMDLDKSEWAKMVMAFTTS